jgi:hypothetical protein
MIQFISYYSARDYLEINVDEAGIDELIDLLQTIKSSKDHFHLLENVDFQSVTFPDEDGFNFKQVDIRYSKD